MGTAILNPQWQIFADAYLELASAERAAIKAGYSPKSARSTGGRLLQKAEVQSYLARIQNKQAAREMSRRERIVAELEKLAFANIEKFTRLDEDGRRVIDFSNATPEDLAAVTSIKTKTRHVYTPKGEHIATEHHDQFTMADKLRGLELLAKTEGMFADNEVKVTVDVADRLLAARQRMARLSAPRSEEAEGE